MSNKSPLIQVCLSRSWGGLEMAAFELAFEYNFRSINLTTICPAGSRLEEKLRGAKLPFITVDSRKYFSPVATGRIRQGIKGLGCETVILHQLPDIWLVQPALIGLRNVRLVGFAHMFLSHGKNDILHQRLYARMDKLICLTETQKKNFLHNLPIKEEQIAIIPNGVDSRKFAPKNRSVSVRESFGVKDEILIGVIGRLDKLKGQVETIEAARILRDKNLTFKIVLVGEDTVNTGGTRSKLEALIKESKLENNVVLAGFRSDIPAVVASLDILAMPSWAETFGRVLIEAMASRTPVVATDAGGVPDIVDNGVDGLLVPPQNPEKLAQALETLILDSNLREKFRDNGERKVRAKFDSKIVQENLDRLLLVGDTHT